MEVIKILKECTSLSDAATKLGLNKNKVGLNKVKSLFNKNGIDYNIVLNGKPKKYKRINKECPVCKLEFETLAGHKKEKTVCSRSCSNSFFRAGKSHPNFKANEGRKLHEHLKKIKGKCEECDFANVDILQIHHIDRIKTNNKLKNLKVLCPNCHAIEHYNSKDGIYSSFKLNQER